MIHDFYVMITAKRFRRAAYPLIVPTSSVDGRVEGVDFLRGLIVETSGVIHGGKLRGIMREEHVARMAELMKEEMARRAPPPPEVEHPIYYPTEPPRLLTEDREYTLNLEEELVPVVKKFPSPYGRVATNLGLPSAKVVLPPHQVRREGEEDDAAWKIPFPAMPPPLENSTAPPPAVVPKKKPALMKGVIHDARRDGTVVACHAGATLQGKKWDAYVALHRANPIDSSGMPDVDAAESKIRRSAQPPGLFRNYGGESSRAPTMFTNMKGV